jgi:glycine cleavage system H lipoate-binding protein
MTVLLVLALFSVMLLAEYLFEKRRQPALIAEATPKPAVADARLTPAVVAGFNVMDHLRYHPGHTWALQESPELVRVGADDFAARLTGHVERINLPATGTWVRQGQKAVSIERNGKKVDLVSPIEGIIVETNAAVAANPDLAMKDPYGEGWLFKVSAPDAKTSFRNLLGGSLVRRWMEEAGTRLRAAHFEPLAAAVAQDGGVIVDDIGSMLTDDQWAEVGREFFLN